MIYSPVSSMYPSVPVSDSLPGGRGHLVTSLPPDAGSFAPLPLGVRLTHTIPSYSYWNFQLEQTEAGYIQFSFAIPRGSSIGESHSGCHKLETNTCFCFRPLCSEERHSQSDHQ